MPQFLTIQFCSAPRVSSRAVNLQPFHGAIPTINFHKEVAHAPRERGGGRRRPSIRETHRSHQQLNYDQHSRSRAQLGSSSVTHSSSGSEIWKALTHDSRKGGQEPIRTLLLDNYDSYTYNLFQLLSIINGAAPVVLRNDEIEWDDLCRLLYKERAFHNVVISPGPGSPTRAQDVGICMRLLQECHDIPILGVCLGHQALGYVHGAQILHAPETVHGRLSEIEHTGHPLFESIPSGLHSGFKVVRYHSLVVDAATLPQDLVPTAWTVLESGLLGPEVGFRKLNEIASNGHLRWQGGGDCSYSNGHPNGVSSALPRCYATKEAATASAPKRHTTKVLMGLSHRKWPHHGVQFHPESVATRYGKEILVNFRNMTVKFWEEQLWRPATAVISNLQAKKLEKSRPPDAGLFHITPNRENAPPSEWSVPLLRVVDRSLSAQANSAVEASIAHAQSCSGAESKGHGAKGVVKSETSAWEGEHLRLHFQKLPKLASKAGGSRTLFCKLFAEEAVEDTFWLDSSSREQRRARFSFMGGRGGSLWRRITYRIANDMVDMRGGVLKFQNAAGQVKETVVQGGFLDFLNRELELRQCRKEDYASLPFDFCGGFIGYLGYELKEECGAKSNRHKSPMPDAGMFLADRMVVVDHESDDVYVLALYQAGNSLSSSPENPQSYLQDPFPPSNSGCSSSSCEEVVTVCGIDRRREEQFLRSESLLGTSSRVPTAGRITNEKMRLARVKYRFERRAAESWVEKISDKVRGLAQQQQDSHEILSEGMHRVNLVSPVHTMANEEKDLRPPFVAETSRSGYIKDVKRCQELIRDGESYEICLTTRLRRKVPAAAAAAAKDGIGLYLTLRETNPAPYSSWLHFGEDGPCICSSSPERFLQLDRKGVLEAKPIKGTAPRGNNPIEDEKLKSELQLSEKDQAENLMIVDLLRNDLGRVCEPGTVHVPSLMSVESYSTVHTMVSTVRGQKRPDMTAVDCVRAAFPGGSMTGAPKLRTMEIIDSLEKSPRGVYSGSIGYFSFNSSFDLNIVIRTVVIHEGEASLGAGGAVIALSDPASEYEEMLLKTKAPIRAVGKYESDSKVPTSNTSEQRGPLLPLGF